MYIYTLNIYVYTYIHTCMCFCVHTYVFIWMICIVRPLHNVIHMYIYYIYVCTYIYTLYIYIYIYLYIHVCAFVYVREGTWSDTNLVNSFVFMWMICIEHMGVGTLLMYIYKYIYIYIIYMYVCTSIHYISIKIYMHTRMCVCVCAWRHVVWHQCGTYICIYANDTLRPIIILYLQFLHWFPFVKIDQFWGLFFWGGSSSSGFLGWKPPNKEPPPKLHNFRIRLRKESRAIHGISEAQGRTRARPSLPNSHGSPPPEDTQCQVCQSLFDEKLLCDICNADWYFLFLLPLLTTILSGIWKCPSCPSVSLSQVSSENSAL